MLSPFIPAVQSGENGNPALRHSGLCRGSGPPLGRGRAREKKRPTATFPIQKDYTGILGAAT